MSLKTRLQPYSFVLGLILSLFSFSSCFASGTYTAYYSSDYQFRVTDVYFDENDLLTYVFDLDSNSSKSAFYVLIDLLSEGSNPRPSVTFSTCDGSTCTSFGSQASSHYLNSKYGYFCEDVSLLDVVSCPVGTCYSVPKGQSILCHSYHVEDRYIGDIYNATGITKQDLLNNSIDLENDFYLNGVNPMYSDNTESYYQVTGTNPAIFTSATNGVCGSDHLQQLTAAPTNLCSSGTAGTVYWNPIEQEWLWSCHGSGGGSNTSCYAHLAAAAPMDGVCGSANGQTVSSVDINDKCLTGIPDTNTYTTLTGFTWFCWGINGGTNVACSATNSTPETYPTPPETNPVPTPTDCSTETGLNQIVCNITNTIEGMFLPSQAKITEFQDTINSINQIFPFSYLSVIGNLFSGTTVTDGTLTMTLLGNTASLGNDFFAMPLFSNVKLFMTIMVLLMFTFWAINYIKHFFK